MNRFCHLSNNLTINSASKIKFVKIGDLRALLKQGLKPGQGSSFSYKTCYLPTICTKNLKLIQCLYYTRYYINIDRLIFVELYELSSL